MCNNPCSILVNTSQYRIVYQQQTERSFSKQFAIPVVRRKSPNAKRKLRMYRKIGLGFRTPAEVKYENITNVFFFYLHVTLPPFCILLLLDFKPYLWPEKLLTIKNERAFQKQFGINLNRKLKPGVTKKKVLRRYRDIGLGFKTPREVS